MGRARGELIGLQRDFEEDLVASGAGLIDPLALEINIIFGLDLVFAAEFYPTVEASLAGGSIDSQSPHALWTQAGRTSEDLQRI